MLMPDNDAPLAGKTIAITRPLAQAGGLIERLRSLGAMPVATPTIEIVPPADFTALDGAIADLAAYNWLLLTSVNGVETFMARATALRIDPGAFAQLSVGAIGPATARALEERGIPVMFVPRSYQAESILAEIGDVNGQRMLLPRAELARRILAEGLRERGAVVDEIAAYQTVAGPGIPLLAELLRSESLAAIAFTSSSTVRFCYEGLLQLANSAVETQRLLALPAIVCIGPVTAATAIEFGLRVDVVADSFTIDGLVGALQSFFTSADSSRRGSVSPGPKNHERG